MKNVQYAVIQKTNHAGSRGQAAGRRPVHGQAAGRRLHKRSRIIQQSLVKTFLTLVGITLQFTSPAFAEEETSSTFTLSSSAFKNGDTIPAMYTCDGKDKQPELSWTNPPPNTKSFALILSDPDAPRGTFFHWVLFNIPAKTSLLPEGMINPPAGAQAGNNGWDKHRYNGPCPPPGPFHHYTFMLYALDTKLNLSVNADAKTVLDAMQTHVLGETVLTGTYGR